MYQPVLSYIQDLETVTDKQKIWTVFYSDVSMEAPK